MFSKHSFAPLVAAAVILTLAIASPAAAQQRRASDQVGAACVGGFQALFDEIEPVPLSAAEEEAVVYLREEEKLARDVYLMLADKWQLPIFTNIARAEQKHMDMVFRLIEVYDLVDPVTDDTIGAFTNPDLGALYLQLVADGEVSLIAALTVGATIEDMDLNDLYLLIELTDNDHIEMVSYNLAKGSRNHMRAFVRALEAQGESYSTIYLDEDAYAAIFEADMERRTFYNADGEPVPACGAEVGGFGVRRGISGNSRNGGDGGIGGQDNGSGSGTGECDGTGSTDGGHGSGTGECDGSGSTDGGNGN
jgi:hypothetical protein